VKFFRNVTTKKFITNTALGFDVFFFQMICGQDENRVTQFSGKFRKLKKFYYVFLESFVNSVFAKVHIKANSENFVNYCRDRVVRFAQLVESFVKRKF